MANVDACGIGICPTDCFEGLVGLRHVCDDGEVCLYVNDLPGVSLKTFAKTATEEDGTGAELFKRLRREAARQVANDFMGKLSKTVTFKDVLDHSIVGTFSNQHVLNNVPKWAGRRILSHSTNPHVKARVDYIEVKSRTSAVKEFHYEVDGIGGNSIRHILRPGITRIPMNLTGGEIRIWFDISDLELYDTGWSTDCTECCEESCNTCHGCASVYNEYSECCATWKSANIMPFRVSVSCICDRSDLVCYYANLLADALRYKIAVLLMEEAIYSDRTNYFVRNSSSEARGMIASIMGGEDPDTGFKQPSKYWQAIQVAVSNVKENLNGNPCLSCTGRSIKIQIP